MKWTRRKLYGLNALAVLCLLFPAPDSRASEGALRADSHEIIEQNRIPTVSPARSWQPTGNRWRARA